MSAVTGIALFMIVGCGTSGNASQTSKNPLAAMKTNTGKAKTMNTTHGNKTASPGAQSISSSLVGHGTIATSTIEFNLIMKQTYLHTGEADKVVTNLENNFGSVYPDGPPVLLGTGIKATFNGGAGQYRYQWKEGNWTIDMLGFGDSNLGLQVAKNVVSYLHTYRLPAPRNNGIILMTSSAAGTTWRTQVVWQEGTTVYEVQQAGNPKHVLEMVVNSTQDGASGNQVTSFHQVFQGYGGTQSMFLTPSIGFQVMNLGGGASNFFYQFAKTIDGGQHWTKESVGHFSDVQGVSFINQQTGYLLNNSPAYAITPDLFVTHNSGATWVEQKLPIPSQFKNEYRFSSYPIFFSRKIGFIPVYGESENETLGNTTRFLYMLVTTDGGISWSPYVHEAGKGLSWTMQGQTLTVNDSTQKITIHNLFSNWQVSSGE